MCLVRVNARTLKSSRCGCEQLLPLLNHWPDRPRLSPDCRSQANLSRISYAKTEETKRQVDSSTYDASRYRINSHVKSGKCNAISNLDTYVYEGLKTDIMMYFLRCKPVDDG